MALRNDINAEKKADLENYDSAVDGQAYILLGQTDRADRAARIYYYDSTSTATADGDNILENVTELGGRYFKLAVEVKLTTNTADTASFDITTGILNIPPQIQSDWSAVSGLAAILNKPALFSGNYNDLIGKPSIPTNNNQLTNGANFVTQTGARSAISLTTSGLGAATYSAASGVLNIPIPIIPTIQKEYISTGTISGGAGNVVFYLTSDGTATGTALFTNINYVSPIVNDSTTNYTYGWSYNSTTKALTVNIKSTTALTVAALGLTLLGVPANAASGTIVNIFVKGN